MGRPGVSFGHRELECRGGGFNGSRLGLSHDPDQVRKEIDSGLGLECVDRNPVAFIELGLRSKMLIDIRTSRISGAFLAQEGLVVMRRHFYGQTIRGRGACAFLHEAARHNVKLVRGVRPSPYLSLQLSPKATVESLVLRGHIGHIKDRVVHSPGTEAICRRDLMSP